MPLTRDGEARDSGRPVAPGSARPATRASDVPCCAQRRSRPDHEPDTVRTAQTEATMSHRITRTSFSGFLAAATDSSSKFESSSTRTAPRRLEDLFAPHHAHETARLIAEAEADPGRVARIHAARERVHRARARLAQYKRALDEGGDDKRSATGSPMRPMRNERPRMRSMRQ